MTWLALPALAVFLAGCVFDHKSLPDHPNLADKSRFPEARVDQSHDSSVPDQSREARPDGPVGICAADGPACRKVTTGGGDTWQAGVCSGGGFIMSRNCPGACDKGYCLPPAMPPDCRQCGKPGADCGEGEVCGGFVATGPSGGAVLRTCCTKEDKALGSSLGNTPCKGDPTRCATGLCTDKGYCYEACVKVLGNDPCANKGRECQSIASLSGLSVSEGWSCAPAAATPTADSGTPDVPRLDSTGSDFGVFDSAKTDTPTSEGGRCDIELIH